MPRRSRIVVLNIPLHIIQRGNNKQACFFVGDDYLFYLKWLEEYALTSGCLIYVYVLMTNHVHLLVIPKSSSSAGDLLKRLGQRYIELNPVRAGIVEHSGEFKWSSIVIMGREKSRI